MSIGRINIGGILTSISMGINESEIEKNEFVDEDTIELDEVIKEVNNINEL